MKGPLIIGNGYVAHLFLQALPGATLCYSKIYGLQQAQSIIAKSAPSFLINCAGITGRPNVDWCETHVPETFFGNVALPIMLATAAHEQGVHFTNIGSGCIYEGDNLGKGYSELDLPNFKGSAYSRSKALAEQALTEFSALQIRLRMPLDHIPGSRNLLTKLISYAQTGNPIVSAPNSISYMPDFVQAVRQLIHARVSGVYNVINPGAITHEFLLREYEVQTNVHLNVRFISPSELDTRTAARRSNCVLSTVKLEERIGKLPAITSRVPEIVKRYIEQERGTP